MTRSAFTRWMLGGALCASLGLLCLGLGACNTPFIPIPPPDPTFMPVTLVDAVGAERVAWETSGPASTTTANARIYVFNATVGEGVIARAAADGAYVASPLEGRAGDRIELYYENAKGERSAVICRPLQEGTVRTPCP